MKFKIIYFYIPALYDAVINDNIEIVQLLLSNVKTDPNIMNKDALSIIQETALFLAIEKENIEIVRLLLSNDKTNPNIFGKNLNAYQKSALYLAVEKENIEIVRLLLSNDTIDINNLNSISAGLVYESYNETALFLAVEKQNIEIIKLLISNDKIDPNIMSEYTYKPETPNQCRKPDYRYFTYKKSALYLAVEKRNIDIIELLISNDKIDPNILNEEVKGNEIGGSGALKTRNTALHLAVKQKNAKIVQLLIDCKSINFKVNNQDSKKPYEITNDETLMKLFQSKNIDMKPMEIQSINNDPNNFQHEQQMKNEENQLLIKYNELKSQFDQMKIELQTIKQDLKQQKPIIEAKSIIDLEKDIELLKSGQEENQMINVACKKNFTTKFMKNQNSMKLQNLQNLMDEFKIMRKLNHPNVLRPYDIIINDKELPPFILFEYCSMNLEDAVKKAKLTKVQKAFIIYQIAEGIKYIHSCRITHQNLIPSNILISEDDIIKICGFENAQSNSEEKLKTCIDVYSFADIVYFILSGGEFPKNRDENELESSSFSKLAQQLIMACWFENIEHRPSFEIIIDVLEKNNFDLISLSQQEIKQVSEMINQYKAKVLF